MLALVFPGQASQAVGMGADLRAASASARELFALADRITGLPLAQLCAAGPLERLTETDVAQPAVVATSLAALASLRERIDPDAWQPAAVAGHSVGEITACVAAGAVDEASALRLVHVRAQAMAAACAAIDGSMAAVIGLDLANLSEACEAVRAEGDGSVEIANLNAPGQLIISGDRRAVERAGQRARAAGARRVLPLNVGGPFHSTYMRPTAAAFERALAETHFEPARVPLVANATADVLTQPDALRHALAVQLYSPVRWIECLERLAELGCDRFLEVGPGTVLAGLVRRTLPQARVASFGSLADLAAARSLLLDEAG